MVLRKLILTVSTFGGCGGLEITEFLNILTVGGCGGHDKN